ncbi:IclR family transcriptional regulator [Microbispora triticiradicis]|uniref:IclR family transcriptional regulator n=2 Tax=Microbispora triticiradicis TaxID=2200763 RepID=A0ABX9LIV0_9ACTN|nr:IclR family transcriptional regulator [Microbispora triticiradicis]GLW24157.1 IclR family transcriptional regulator [Microbispora amethystogenes]
MLMERSGRAETASALGSLERGIAILFCLAVGMRPMNLTQVHRSTGFSKTTTHRLLGVLQGRGLVTRRGGDYTVDGRFAELLSPRGWPVQGRRVPDCRRAVLPYLLQLYEATRQTVNLAVPDRGEVAYVERLYGHNRVRSPSDGVDRAPLHCTAAGKALLAHDAGLRKAFYAGPAPRRMTGRTVTGPAALERELAGVRGEGVSYAREEYAEGVCCAAAPVFAPDGRVCMVVSVAAPAGAAALPRLGPAVRRTAHQITGALSTVLAPGPERAGPVFGRVPADAGNGSRVPASTGSPGRAAVRP